MIFSFSLLFSISFSGIAYSKDKNNSNERIYKLLNKFGDILERIRKDYVREPNDEVLIQGAIEGMLRKLDPHSSYLDSKTFQNMQASGKDTGGAGLELTKSRGYIKVVSPIEGGPAEKAGILPGDFITRIDGEDISYLNLEQVVSKIRGPVKTHVVLTIVREGRSKPFSIKIVRNVIYVPSVKVRVIEKVAYIRITQLSTQTTAELKSQLKRVQGLPDIKGYVLDLRNNPGGLLEQAVSVSDAFLEQGSIVIIRGRNAKDSKREHATKGDLTAGKKLVVLINSGTAAGAEIIAGALKDHKRASLVGTRSFGSGSIQTIIPLGSEGALRLTTAYYYSPAGRSYQARGVEPDFVVKQSISKNVKHTSKPRDFKKDAQFQFALRLVLKASAEKKSSKKQTSGKKCDKSTDLEFWKSVKNSNSPAEIQTYIDACPNGRFVSLAKIRLKKVGKNK